MFALSPNSSERREIHRKLKDEKEQRNDPVSNHAPLHAVRRDIGIKPSEIGARIFVHFLGPFQLIKGRRFFPLHFCDPRASAFVLALKLPQDATNDVVKALFHCADVPRCHPVIRRGYRRFEPAVDLSLPFDIPARIRVGIPPTEPRTVPPFLDESHNVSVQSAKRASLHRDVLGSENHSMPDVH